MSEDTAWPYSKTVYELNGYLRENMSDIKSRGKFGFHLISIGRGELEKSDSSQKLEQQLLLQQQEEKEFPKKKKPRLSLSNGAAPELVSEAKRIGALHLGDYFDPFSLYC